MKLWFKLYRDTHLLQDLTVEKTEKDTRTHKVFEALEEACTALDLGRPIWLDKNVSEFGQRAKTRFRKDNFVEEFPYEYLEMQVLEEDY